MQEADIFYSLPKTVKYHASGVGPGRKSEWQGDLVVDYQWAILVQLFQGTLYESACEVRDPAGTDKLTGAPEKRTEGDGLYVSATPVHGNIEGNIMRQFSDEL